MRISDWSSDVCSADLLPRRRRHEHVPQIRFFCLRLEDLQNRNDLPAVRAEIRDLLLDDRLGRIDERIHEVGDLLDELLLAGGIFEIHCRYPCLTGSGPVVNLRSEEHTSELQSLMRSSYAVFCLKQNNV